MNLSSPKIKKSAEKEKINLKLMHEIIESERANMRQMTAHAKTRREVSGGGRKPYRQKGTGRARAGSRTSPIWRGGGVTFGPDKNRDFSKNLTKRKKKKALRQAVMQRIKEGNLKIADKIEVKENKTRNAKLQLEKSLGKKESGVLLVLDKEDSENIKAYRNLKNIEIINQNRLSAYNIIKNENIIFTKNAWKNFKESRGIKE